MHNIDEWFSRDENVKLLINRGREALADELFNRTKCRIETTINATVKRAMSGFAGEAVFMDFAGLNWNEVVLLFEVCRYRIEGPEGFEESFGTAHPEDIIVFGWLCIYERYKGILHTGEDKIEWVIAETTLEDRIEAAMNLFNIVYLNDDYPMKDANYACLIYLRMLWENSIESALIYLRSRREESLCNVYERTRHFVEEVNHGQAML